MKKCTTEEEMYKVIAEAKENMKKPLSFGICRNDMSRMVNKENTCLQSNFFVTNFKENFGSSAVFRSILLELSKTDPSIIIHSSDNEEVFNITPKFVDQAVNVFAPILELASLDKHVNAFVIKLLNSTQDLLANEATNNPAFAWGKGQYIYRMTFIFNDMPPETVESGYLKLYLLGEGKVRINSLNLFGIFNKFTNCAWTNNGQPLDLEIAKYEMIENKVLGRPNDIVAIDKFPRMLQHVIPTDTTRILDSSKVRMGAQLASGTVVMPGASYINFNAGTEGPVMVEGRISSSAVVGAGTDIGGGASILGTLSGGNNTPITIGKNCLLEANSVTGISLGDECIVSACCEILAGTKVTITPVELNKILKVNPESKIEPYAIDLIFKGKELAGLHGITYRRDNESGQIIAIRTTRFNRLNPELH